jgi:subtilisin family serine protease
MKYKIEQTLDIRSMPSTLSGKIFGRLQPGFIIDVVEETLGSHAEVWLKDGNGFYYEKRLVTAPTVAAASGLLDLNLKAPWLKENFDVSSAWSTSTGKGINLAILDSGIFAHEDLASNISTAYQKSFVGGSMADTDGHGTHIAGIIAANGTKQLIGVAPNVNIIPIKVFEKAAAKIDTAVLIKALEYTASIPDMHLINLSLSANYNAPNYPKLQAVIEAIIASGIVVVGASGNNWGNYVSAPANIDKVIAVSALSRMKSNHEEYQIPLESNFGSKVDTACIGYQMVSCGIEPGSTCIKSGTSMAAGYMSGVMALKLQHLINSGVAYHPEQLIAQLRKTTFARAKRKNNPNTTLPVFNPLAFIHNQTP